MIAGSALCGASFCRRMSSLSAFIRQHNERILLEWETFARALSPVGTTMDVAALRDHAEAMLDVIAADLDTPQTARRQADKAKGLEDVPRGTTRSAAAEHGSRRAASGFTVVQMVAEFRALRASVVRLWTAQLQLLGPAEVEDLIRFNEAIDQAVAESLARYSREIDGTRERFLAILGHDLRNPLGAITTSTRFLLEGGASAAEQVELIRGIENAGRRMSRLVSDLLELALSRLGDGMPVNRTAFDLGTMVGDVVAEVGASYPRVRIKAHIAGDLPGRWDRARLAQALTNLVGNAVQHGDANSPITVEARHDAGDAIIVVHNRGPVIPPEKLDSIFDGMKPGTDESRDRHHLGLGLFIVDKIIQAHGGTIDVHSMEESGTTFTVRLPGTSA